MATGERLRRRETATRDGRDSGLAVMTATAYGVGRYRLTCWELKNRTCEGLITQKVFAMNFDGGIQYD